MPQLDDLPTPALVLDLDRLEANLDRMAERAAALGVRLRPHLKTHKCVEIARLQQQRGARGVTVSTLYEARVFADAGFADITWAFPLVPSRLDQALELARRIDLGLVVDSPEAVAVLERSEASLAVFLKVDCGYHRAGLDPESSMPEKLAWRLAGSERLTFAGLLSHSGHAYAGRASCLPAGRQERDVMTGLADRLRAAGLEVPVVSVGSTPGMAAIDHLQGVDEARPGNYALYDWTQVRLGSCEVADCAATVVTTVVSSSAGHSVVDAGALALSKDPGPAGDGGFGRVYADHAAGRLEPGLRLTALSQEHGIVDAPLPVGTRLRVLPNHSCLTVAQFDEFHVARGERQVDRWKIWRGRD